MSRRERILLALLMCGLFLTLAVVFSHGVTNDQGNSLEQEMLLEEWKSSVEEMARQQRYREAVPTLRNYLRHAPKDSGMRRLLGKVLFEIRRYSEARDVYYVALLHDPEDFVARNNLGVVLAKQGKFQDSLRELREAFASSEQELFVGANLARVCELSGDPRAAGEVWRVLSGAARGEVQIPDDALILDNAALAAKP